jgi:hypothetical protein
MSNIPLQAIPNQTFSIQLDNNQYDFTLTTNGNITCCTIARNGVVLVSGSRIPIFQPLIPYPYLAEPGNFVFVSSPPTQDYPYWPMFGITQFLIYVSAAELEAALAAA